MKAGRKSQIAIQAAGGIVIRPGRSPLFAVVQRRKDNYWVLPKGKLKAKENAVAAARREAVEETGQSVTVHEYLGSISYKAGRRPKVVGFWRMQAAGGSPREPTPDIRAVEWLGLEDAIARLTQPLERAFLAHIASRAIKAMRAAPVRRAPRKILRKRSGARKLNGHAAGEPPPALAAKPNLLQRLFARFERDARY
jgi:8-oxo-dGTP diphosphatase